MPRYRVYLQTIADTSVQVDAADKEEAYELATGGDLPTLCAQCSGWGGHPGVELGDVWEVPDGDVEQYVEEIP